MSPVTNKMRIINKTNNSVLAENVIIADTPFTRMKGLLGKKKFSKGQALILNPCNSIHMFFMRFPIDVLFLDKNNRIVKAISSIRPFCLTAIYFKAKFAVELPVGTTLATNTQAGDCLLIE